MATESNMNIIDTKDEGIVVKEIPISISDEKLRNSLSCAYEEAQKDMSTFHFYNLYSVFLSIASTLFLSLLTSDFHAIGSITAEKVTIGAWVICISSGFLGAILACYKVSQKTKNDTSNRDVAVYNADSPELIRHYETQFIEEWQQCSQDYYKALKDSKLAFFLSSLVSLVGIPFVGQQLSMYIGQDVTPLVQTGAQLLKIGIGYFDYRNKISPAKADGGFSYIIKANRDGIIHI